VITVSHGLTEATVEMLVSEVTDITVPSSSIELLVGGTQQITATPASNR
jgi:hypothetical protein